MGLQRQDGMFTVTDVGGYRIVRVTISGIMTLEQVSQLAEEQAGLSRRLGYKPYTFDVLIDVSRCPIQLAPVCEALSFLSEKDEFRPARLAFVHQDGPVKMQVRRINAGKNARYFTEEAEAMAWLAS